MPTKSQKSTEPTPSHADVTDMPELHVKTQPRDTKGIIQLGDPVLHEVAAAVPVADIKSEKIQKIISKMKEVLNSQDDGIGLAAPQIGISLRIFLVSGKVLLPPDERIEITTGNIHHKKITVPDDLVFINPVITKASKEKKWMEGEGCLSVRWLYGKVYRSTKVSVEAYDEHGEKFERGAGGLMAHIFQHEIDHLDGILFIDKAKDIEELEEEERPHAHQ